MFLLTARKSQLTQTQEKKKQPMCTQQPVISYSIGYFYIYRLTG